MANYLYNCIELPQLPESDLPHAYIYDAISFGTSTELLFTENPVAIAENNVGVGDFVHTLVPCRLTQYRLRGGVWELDRDVTQPTYYGPSNQVVPIWSNTDISWCTDGNGSQPIVSENLYLAASDPVPVNVNPPDPLSLVMGYRVGCAIRANRGKKTPVAYLFNGVELPALPERDEKTYCCAFMLDYTDAIYLFFASYNLWAESVYNGTKVSLAANNSGTMMKYQYMTESDKWEYVTSGDSVANAAFTVESEPREKCIWNSADILNSDGSVYLSASDPIPVYA